MAHDAADAILILDNERRIVATNRAAWELFRMAAEDLEGRRVDELVTEDVDEVLYLTGYSDQRPPPAARVRVR